jgi:hypothetical protein
MPANNIATLPSSVIPRATHGSADRPLIIGGVEIPCFVLEDGTRVIALNGMLRSLDMSSGGPGRGPRAHEGADRLARFAVTNAINPFISNDLMSRIQNPLKFRKPTGGSTTNGYEATILVDLCDAILAARSAGSMTTRQKHIAARAEILMRGFARLGIIALVDECTGYQEDRDRDALHKLLSLYLTGERLAWAKTFPDEYYENLYRLRGWTWPMKGTKRPQLVGYLTNRLVYDRLPPTVLEELQRRNPLSEETGRRRWKHFQFLSEDFGQKDLRNHMLQLLTAMRLSPDWETFMKNLDLAFPQQSTPAEVLAGAERKAAD